MYLEMLFDMLISWSTGSSAADPTLRRRIEPWEFENFFDPRQLRKEACLLYEIKWGKRQTIWRNSARNTTQHVEINFLEKLTKERHLSPSVRCSITWFLSWSPCWECAKAIGEFLTQHPSVSLVIYVARLFWHMDEQNRQGLRDLIHSGVTIQTMREPEYEHCWRNFVNYPPGGEHHCPRYPSLLMGLYALELHCVILGLPSCFQISRRRQDQLRVFRFMPQMCHYQKIPPNILFQIGCSFP
ncbi:C-_U-editing enzyme APOBEC-1-like [Suncus etruscus]|uniref:C->U-editing enzyme APOBEC-1-like n=1 Tax=Suncus etruscus TaxID=109475 RepID=UPI00210F6C38|nr:C->U-editing enzyme APOBEC-1-like [Suncus etruscus]